MAEAQRGSDPKTPAPIDLRELMDSHGDRLLRSAYLLCGNRTEAQDLVQETYLQAMKSGDRFRGDSAVYTWLYGILLNLCRRDFRRQKRLVFEEERVLGAAFQTVPADELDRGTTSQGLELALQKLTPAHREVIILRYYESMKISKTFVIGFAVAIAVVCLKFAIVSARAADSFVIQPEVGATEFAAGDRITITSLRGNEEHLALGGRYTLDGTYTLSSADSADLAWFSTSRGAGGPTPVSDSEHVEISRGTGNFHLEKTLLNDGWLHLTFYVDGHPHGGIYFGEKGFEDTVLKRKNWADFSSPQSGGQTNVNPDLGSSTGNQPADRANRAIMAFLGDPVPAPATLDPRYTQANLKAAFNSLTSKLGLTVQRLEVDESEFPYVLFGLVAGRCDYHALADGFRHMEGYYYGGSVTGTAPGGGTNFAIDIIPESQLPKDRAGDCSRRLMIRLEMLADSVSRGEGGVILK